MGAEVRALRKSLGWTQNDLAERAQLGKPGTVSELELGCEPSTATFEACLRAINQRRRTIDPQAAVVEVRFLSDADRQRLGNPPIPAAAPGLDSLEGFWLETIAGDPRPHHSVGHFHRRDGRWRYDGWNESEGHGWNSFLCELDERYQRIIYSFEHHRHGQERGDGFGAIQLRLTATGPVPTRGWYVIIRGQEVSLHQLTIRPLADVMAENQWINPDMHDDDNRRRFLRRLGQRRARALRS